MKLTQERIKEVLEYNPDTGVFFWKIDRGPKIKKGILAGGLDINDGYWKKKIDGKGHKAHRLAFLFMEGYLPENEIDHKDRNRTNNKWDNLREVSHMCNIRNCNIYKTNNSGVTGVSWHKATKKWLAKINTPKRIHLGVFSNIMDAIKARWEAEVKYNFPNCNTTSSAYNYLKQNGGI